MFALPPSNPAVYHTPYTVILHNYRSFMTQTNLDALFQENQVGCVSEVSPIPGTGTAQVVINKWFPTDAAHIALQHLTFSKFFDVKVENTSQFYLFTVEKESKLDKQRLNGPPGLPKKVPLPCAPYVRQYHDDGSE